MLKRLVVGVHRWLGVGMCVLFLLWFCSGIGMMYWDFPAVAASDRLQRSSPIDLTRVKFSPADALGLAHVAQAQEFRLNTYDGRPVYRVRGAGTEVVVYADTGEVRGAATTALMLRVAAQWARQPAPAATAAEVVDVDQWTVQSPLRTLRPMWKFSWPDGQRVYVAANSGEVVQYTTTASRIGAYLGPIPHWLYFTALRKHQHAWTTVVVWTSGIATVAALLGLVVGLWMYSPSKRYRYNNQPSRVPYTGQKRWHMVFGLVFGVGAATWAFSGLLSMDPFPPTESPAHRASGSRIASAVRQPLDGASFSGDSLTDALAPLHGEDVREVELINVGGRPCLLTTFGDGTTKIVEPGGSVEPMLDDGWLSSVIRAAVQESGGGEVRRLTRPDLYYMDRRRPRPLPVLVAELRGADRSRYYIDPRTARMVGAFSEREWTTRWLYHGLHSLEFPLIYERPLWDVVMIGCMLGGAALSATSIVLAWRVVAGAVR